MGGTTVIGGRDPETELRRFNKALRVAITGIVISLILSSISLYYTITDDTSELLRSQIELQRSTIQELQKSEQVLLDIEKNNHQLIQKARIDTSRK